MGLDRSERQKLGVRRWIESGCRSSLCWATGVGKTWGSIIAIKWFLTKNKNKTIVVVVPTEYLKIQWIQELNKNNLLNDVTVEIINTAAKLTSSVDFLVLDEVHRVGGETFYLIFSNRKPKIVLGLSATFDRLDGRHELLNQYCPVCDTITVKEAIENKWLSPYREYKVMISPDNINEYKLLNKQFIETFSVFDFSFDTAMKCMTDIIYRRVYAKRMGIPTKEIDAIVFTWGRALRGRKSFVMNHPKKLDITRKILAARPNSKAITFSATIKQAELIGGFVVHSGMTKKKNRITMEEFSNMKTGVINSAKSLDEGADIKGLNLAIILCNSSSVTQKVQRMGRCIRFEEGKEAEIFTLVIKGTMEEGWFATSTAGKNYIEITEDELDDILRGKESENVEQTAIETELLFRL